MSTAWQDGGRIRVRGVNAADQMTKSQVRDFSPVFCDEPGSLGGADRAPTPLELMLCALAADLALAYRQAADEAGTDPGAVEVRAEGVIDVRGSEGVEGVKPYFESVSVNVASTAGGETPGTGADAGARSALADLFRRAGTRMDVSVGAR